ncbi:MAG: hypothetical protein JWM69_1318 [Candidatus Binatus sp.]|jgi:hypothetical protein|nr:hypothetical protein [Candidatus Binatus sp.]
MRIVLTSPPDGNAESKITELDLQQAFAVLRDSGIQPLGSGIIDERDAIILLNDYTDLGSAITALRGAGIDAIRG